ncbi:hypothetical protein ACA910_002487 [Epithemia clementina (nom. ined.)]
MSKHLDFVCYGIKEQDLFAKDAETGQLVAAKNIQSAHNVWPIDLVIAKEKNSLVQNHLRHVFLDFQEACDLVSVEFGWKDIRLAGNSDLSATWKAMGGGPVKIKEEPCYACSVTTATLLTENVKDGTCLLCNLLGEKTPGLKVLPPPHDH